MALGNTGSAQLFSKGCRSHRKRLSEQKRLVLRALSCVNRPMVHSQQCHRAPVAIVASRPPSSQALWRTGGPGRCRRRPGTMAGQGAWGVRRHKPMTAFEVGAFFGITGGAVAGGVLCKSHGVLATIGGVVGGGVIGLSVGLLYGAIIVLLCGLASVFWQLVTGRLKPDATRKDNANEKDPAA